MIREWRARTPLTFLVAGNFRGSVADGDAYSGDIFWAGTYTYRTVEGIDATVRVYALSMKEAVELIRSPLTNGLPKPPVVDTVQRSSGTGFAISERGHVVTNAHVIKGASKITVFVGEKSYSGSVVATDEHNDLAIIKIEHLTSPLRLNIDHSSELGDDVTVVGYPNPSIQGRSLKLTRGSISGLKGIRDDQRLFQIDAAIQPGNSGGPLLDKSGGVIGIVNARLDDAVVALTGAIPQNVNYAIKIDLLLPLVKRVEGLWDTMKKSEIPDSEPGATSAFSTYLIEVES